jgi:hypothetical protein
MADDIRKTYFEKLGLCPDNEGDRPKRRSAFRRAHEIRTFEIDHYWKRATYFWALEAAIFVAFAAMWRITGTGGQLLAVAFAGIGAITALVGYLSARGSKFWQENWEKHIDLLEAEFEGHLHRTIWIAPKKGLQFSVSRLNQRLSFIFFLFWSLLFLTMLFARLTPFPVKELLSQPFLCILAAFVLCAAVGAGCWLYFFTRTNLDGEGYEVFRRPGPDGA